MSKIKKFLIFMSVIYFFFGFAILDLVETNIALSQPTDWIMWAISSIFILVGIFVPIIVIESEYSFKRWSNGNRK